MTTLAIHESAHRAIQALLEGKLSCPAPARGLTRPFPLSWRLSCPGGAFKRLAAFTRSQCHMMVFSFIGERHAFFPAVRRRRAEPVAGGAGAVIGRSRDKRSHDSVVDLEEVLPREARVNRSLSPSSRKPSSDSVISRYIHPAEPVYQVQPPRPI